MCCRFCVFARLKSLDIEFMKRLHDKVNIIPLVAKADTMTPDECREFKKTVQKTNSQLFMEVYVTVGEVVMASIHVSINFTYSRTSGETTALRDTCIERATFTQREELNFNIIELVSMDHIY